LFGGAAKLLFQDPVHAKTRRKPESDEGLRPWIFRRLIG
jgi:hypothetical protein